MTRNEALSNIGQRAIGMGLDLRRCLIEDFTDPGEGDRFWKLTPPNGQPPIKEYYDPSQLGFRRG